MPLCKLAWEAFVSHSEWREGCGRMLPLQRLDVITSPALPPFAIMTLTSNFPQLPSGRRQPSARNPRMHRSECANADLKPCKHRHTNVAQKLKSQADGNMDTGPGQNLEKIHSVQRNIMEIILGKTCHKSTVVPDDRT